MLCFSAVCIWVTLFDGFRQFDERNIAAYSNDFIEFIENQRIQSSIPLIWSLETEYFVRADPSTFHILDGTILISAHEGIEPDSVRGKHSKNAFVTSISKFACE